MIDSARIRNFCIVAHIDHGKSTLADRLLDATGSLTAREKRDQFLDKMDLERERGITIKAQTARMRYRARDGVEYVLNLIDTPGHVDFSYEVSRALVFDSWFDPYVGAVMLARVFDGGFHVGGRLLMMARDVEHEIQQLFVIDPHPRAVEQLEAGEVGLFVAGIKSLAEVKIGDTLGDAARPPAAPLPGFLDVKPMVFAGLYPVDPDAYENLKTALQKLQLNDASLVYEPETSAALGFGFRCGFLGFLHSEIVQERLEREYNLNLISTAPTVRYRVVKLSGETQEIESPAALPEPSEIQQIEEPMVLATIHVPPEYVGVILALCQERRGTQRDMAHHGSRMQVRYELPLSEIVLDFHDRIKSATRGYGSFDYELLGYQPADLIKLDVLVNGDPVDALSLIVHRDKAFARGTELVRKLKEFIPRQMYEVALQAAIGARVIARTTVKALRKNVTAKCYGGDISRKRKLLERQKEGKRRMKRVGSVEIPQEAFLAALKLGDS